MDFTDLRKYVSSFYESPCLNDIDVLFSHKSSNSLVICGNGPSLNCFPSNFFDGKDMAGTSALLSYQVLPNYILWCPMFSNECKPPDNEGELHYTKSSSCHPISPY